MKASELFIQALENEGVEYIFGIPGEENLDMLDSLSQVKHPVGIDSARAGGRIHGGDVRSADGKDRRLSVDTRTRSDELRDGRGVRATGRDADADDHRTKAGQDKQAGTVSDCRRRRHDAAADEIHATTCQRCQHPSLASAKPFGWRRKNDPERCTWSFRKTLPANKTDEPLLHTSLVRRPTAEDKSIEAAVKRIELRSIHCS